jgi:hypothetical protein
MDERFWTYFIAFIIILASIKDLILPLISPFVFDFVFINFWSSLFYILTHLPLVVGFIYFLIIGGRFNRKKMDIWSIVGVLMIGFGMILPLIQRTYLFSMYVDPVDWLIYEFKKIPETFFYALGFGLWIGFFELNNKKILLLFLSPLLFWILLGSLVPNLSYNLRLNTFGIGFGVDKSMVTTEQGIKLWVFPRCLWNMWFWGEMSVIIPILIYFSSKVYNVYIKNIKLFAEKEELSYGNE